MVENRDKGSDKTYKVGLHLRCCLRDQIPTSGKSAPTTSTLEAFGQAS